MVAEPMCWWLRSLCVGGCGAYVSGVVGLAENKANSAPIELELELRLSLAIYILMIQDPALVQLTVQCKLN